MMKTRDAFKSLACRLSLHSTLKFPFDSDTVMHVGLGSSCLASNHQVALTRITGTALLATDGANIAVLLCMAMAIYIRQLVPVGNS